MSARCKVRGNFDVAEWDFGRRDRASRAKVLGFLILMAECGGHGFWKMLGDQLSGEAGEGSEVSTMYCTQWGRWCLTAKCIMIINSKFSMCFV